MSTSLNSDRPRLLVALKPAEMIDEVLMNSMSGVPYAYAATTGPEAWGEVEVLLVGSVERELGTFDPASTPRLRFVQRVYTGLDGFPFGRFPPSIAIAGNVGGYAPFVAEGAVTLALASARSTLEAHRMVAEGRMRPGPDQSTFRGRSALILGYGAIGREIAQRLSGFGMRIVGVNRAGRMAPGVDAVFPSDRMDDALAEADVIFEVRPLTRATRGSIGKEQFGRMRPGAIFVNVGRAATVVEEALFEHLKTHPGFRAALDVWWEEGFAGGELGRRFPWTDLPNFIGSPHSSGGVSEAARYGLERAVQNVVRFFRGEEPHHLVDRSEYEEPPTGGPSTGGTTTPGEPGERPR